MTALVITSIVLGLLLVLASVGIPLWVSARSLVSEAEKAQEEAYWRAKAAAAAPAVSVPAPRRPVGEAARAPHRVG